MGAKNCSNGVIRVNKLEGKDLLIREQYARNEQFSGGAVIW